MGFVTLLIVTGIIVKVVLGGKKKAERRAQAATATAAEESLKRQLVEAQLKMMQAQVEPHFCSIRGFGRLPDRNRACDRVEDAKNLIQYLRAALPQMRKDRRRSARKSALPLVLEVLKFA
jgi:LytS/YehU family sensor histidine kinase